MTLVGPAIPARPLLSASARRARPELIAAKVIHRKPREQSGETRDSDG